MYIVVMEFTSIAADDGQVNIDVLDATATSLLVSSNTPRSSS